MLISGIWAYLVLEALFVVSLYALFMRRMNRRLRRRRGEENGGAEFTSIDHYVALLQDQILDADAKLAHLANQPDGDSQLADIVAARLVFLRAERQAIDSSGPDREKFWAGISEALRPLLPDTPAAGGDQSGLIGALQARIQAYESRVANLEQFRVNFFELKAKYADAIGLGRQLHTEVGKAIAEDQQSPELREAMEKLKEENTRLEGQLSLVEREFDNIMRNLKAATDRSDLPPSESGIATSMDNIGQGVEKIRGVIGSQEQRIHELTGIISELEIELGDKQQLELLVGEFREKHAELSSVVAIIQEENTFLQEQISALLKLELEDRESTNALKQELQEQREAFVELEKKYVAIEHEYLAAYEENKRLKA